jgi:hypothetical protein
MKILIVILSLFLIRPVFAQSPMYLTAAAQFYPMEQNQLGGGPALSFGWKSNKNFGFGFGSAVLFFTKDADTYIPLFGEVAYVGEKKINPYGSFRIGYGFYNGSGEVVGLSSAVKGGLFMNPNLGATVKVHKNLHFLVAGGLSIMQFRQPKINQDGSKDFDNYDKTLGHINIGLRL